MADFHGSARISLTISDPPSADLGGEPGRIQFYGRRHGHKLRSRRRQLLADRLPGLRIGLPAAAGSLDPARLFAGPLDDIWLEIGFGGGEHLAAQAAAHPQIGFIGCDPFINGVASLVARIEAAGLANIRIFDDDARLLLGRLKPAAIGRAFILFPDPWPKKRHARRRFFSAPNLDLLAAAMKDGADLRFATDDPTHVRWVLEQITRHGDFHWPARGPGDWRGRPADWIETRYESKALAAGGRCHYLCFRRQSRSLDGFEKNA